MIERPDLRVVGADAPDAWSTREGWLEAGRRLSERTERDRWALGDWASVGERAYGDLAAAAGEIGIAHQTIRNLATVARKVELSRRRDSLSWSHHAAIAALPADVGDDLLSRAAAEGWSRETMREEARAASREARLEEQVAALEHALACARAGRDEAERGLRRLEGAAGESARSLLREWEELDIATATFFDPANPKGAAALHGNKAGSAAKRLRARLKMRTVKINEVAKRVDERLKAASVPKGRGR